MLESGVQHQPAMKVGGRRLSVTNRHKPHNACERLSPETEDKMQETGPADYPRPAPHTEHVPHAHVQHQFEEETPFRKDKKHDAEWKLKENGHRKTEPTRPTREAAASQRNQALRISQPAGKALHV
ncbi:hypothetical protein CPB83DRAFT_888295 [Crepidotus variabilis]|uniref:Uncharacterized protein n=1 Tax=Crepidotus variabilis TaxID=179855 RepID=A0A9P6EV18_9AGAR|nr:hypothetical protein CPB83DRAFT_888295 [Crepidotus variabilis]